MDPADSEWHDGSQPRARAPGVTTIVENRPGAGTVIGVEAVARAAPDGNNLLLTNTAIPGAMIR